MFCEKVEWFLNEKEKTLWTRNALQACKWSGLFCGKVKGSRFEPRELDLIRIIYGSNCVLCRPCVFGIYVPECLLRGFDDDVIAPL